LPETLNSADAYPRWKLLLYYLPAVSAWILVQSLVLHRLGLGWQTAFYDSLLFGAMLSLAAAMAVLMYRYYQPGASNRFLRLVFALVITILACSGFEWLAGYVLDEVQGYTGFLEASMPVRYVIALMIISFVTLVNWIWNMLNEQKAGERKHSESTQMVKEAELLMLRQQLQPHFLFNSLNSISALAGSDPGKARQMIQQLSDFLRGTLSRERQQTATLAEELAQLRLYLDIEKVRFAHRLNVEITAPDDCLGSKIPSLLLQPVVENAIKHGLYGTIDVIQISIRAVREGVDLVIAVTNPFDPQTENGGKGTGFGLSSVRRRLALLYSRNDLVHTSAEDHHFTTRVRIPQTL
jgi:two-component system, LytTR family, sensor kinase